MLSSVVDAEDMAQEAFLRWRRASDQEIVSPRAYLATTGKSSNYGPCSFLTEKTSSIIRNTISYGETRHSYYIGEAQGEENQCEGS